VGKSTFVHALALELNALGNDCLVIAADPGSPTFGAPGSVSLGRLRDGVWSVERVAALGSLNAVRYRLPLVQLVRRLAEGTRNHLLLVDMPGVVRGPAAAELLDASLEAVEGDAVLAIVAPVGSDHDATLAALDAVPVSAVTLAPSPRSHRRSKHQRAMDRTKAWDAWLANSEILELDLRRLRLAGRPAAPSSWLGRQLGLLDRAGRTIGFGEVVTSRGPLLQVRVRGAGNAQAKAAFYLVRDARRGSDGLLGSETGEKGAPPGVVIPPDLRVPEGNRADAAYFVHLGAASALLVNGVFGDPLLHIRLRQQRRSMLFDLGDGARLPARIAHQVSDVFISHAHMDHIGGFVWFLRSRIGEPGICRLYGPPGLAGHIAGFVDGVCWDRIGNTGPCFEVHELEKDWLSVTRIQVGLRPERMGGRRVDRGLLYADTGFRVRAVTLDHGAPVLAFAFEPAQGLHIRKGRLDDSGLSPGPWLGELKRRVLAGDLESVLHLPDGTKAPVSLLAARFVLREPARRLVYATDLADTEQNRLRVVDLARGADVLLCEAAFQRTDAAQARRTYHLTAPACGEIAAQAGVRRLIPFHFSRRYETSGQRLYDEVRAAFRGELLIPPECLHECRGSFRGGAPSSE
jgi:ribonuclease BN (tRNA processing enzyme)